MCNVGIVLWIQNNSWQQKHEWPHENSQCKKYWIMHGYSDKGPHKETKQTSGHNCLLLGGALDSWAYGEWRFRNAGESSFGMNIHVPETWEPNGNGWLDDEVRWILHFWCRTVFLNFITSVTQKTWLQRFLLFPKLKYLLQMAMTCHYWRYFKTCYRVRPQRGFFWLAWSPHVLTGDQPQLWGVILGASVAPFLELSGEWGRLGCGHLRILWDWTSSQSVGLSVVRSRNS
jgi:hypothetical protein